MLSGKMTLFKSSKNLLIIAILGQCLIILGAFAILVPLVLNANEDIPKRLNYEVFKIVKDSTSKAINDKKLAHYLRQNHHPWLSITHTKSPIFKKSSYKEVKKILMQKPIATKKVFSIELHDNSWLNIEIKPSKQSKKLFYLAIFSLLLLCLLAISLITYLVIRKLNTPLVNLASSLKQANASALWSSMPLIGNDEENKIYQAINRFQEKINETLDKRTQMLSSISHDLRTPLTRIKLRVENFSDSSHYSKLIGDISEIEQMISELLLYFRDINHKEPKQKFDCVALLGALVDDANIKMRNASFDSPEDKIIYHGQINLLKRAFSNLINNAIYYGKHAYIKIIQKKEKIIITIEDDGKGLDESEIKNIIKPFYRVESSRNRAFGGSGLGLSIAKEIFERHGGELSISNLRDGGLSVCITLNFN